VPPFILIPLLLRAVVLIRFAGDNQPTGYINKNTGPAK